MDSEPKVKAIEFPCLVYILIPVSSLHIWGSDFELSLTANRTLPEAANRKVAVMEYRLALLGIGKEEESWLLLQKAKRAVWKLEEK